MAGRFPDTPELLPGKLVNGLAKLGIAMRHQAWTGAGRRGLNPTQGQVLVVLRAAGGQAEAEEAAGWPAVLLEAVATLDPHEQAAVYRALLKTVRALQVRRRTPISQMCVTGRFFRPNAHADAPEPHHCELVSAAFVARRPAAWPVAGELS